MNLIAAILLSQSANANVFRGIFEKCVNVLGKDNSYQEELERMNTRDLVIRFRMHGWARRLWNEEKNEYELAMAEMVKRLQDPDLTEVEHFQITEALYDYPRKKK